MPISGISVDAVYLRERRVVLEAEVSAVMQVHLRQHGRVIVIWTVDLQAATEGRRYVNLTVIKRGPVVCSSIPCLPDGRQVTICFVIQKDLPVERIGQAQ